MFHSRSGKRKFVQPVSLRALIAAAFALSAVLATPGSASPAADQVAPTGRWDGHTGGGASTPPMGWNS